MITRRCPMLSGNLGLLRLVQWLSPAFPTGGFAYSHGLEWFVVQGEVRDSVSLEAWLRQILTHGAGRQDAVLLALALQDGADLEALARLACALAPSAERLAETMQQGAAFARTAAALTGDPMPARPLPVAVGQAARGLGLEAEQVISLYLQGFAANLVSVGVRFVPLGQTEGQAVLQALHPVIAALAVQAVGAGPDDIAASAFRADMASMLHETMDVRIFRT